MTHPLITSADEKPLLVQPQQREEIDTEICIKYDLRFNLGESRNLKTLAAKTQEEVERKIFCEIKKRMNLNKSQLARFRRSDSKTLRVKLKRFNYNGE